MYSRIPYGMQTINHLDEQAILEVLRSDWLTTGPKVSEFENAFANFCGAKEAIAVCNGTAALHAAMASLEIQKNDEVIVPAMTFAATANAAVYVGAKPVFADVQEDTLLIDPADVERKITSRTRAIVGVDYAGQPCDYSALRAIADRHNVSLIADACHAPGASYQGKSVGTLADITTFSFHPVKHLTTAEGGMITTHSKSLASKMRCFRNHGITTDHAQRESRGEFYYEMQSLGYNYRLSDLQCALGISQLKRLPEWVEKRQSIAALYDISFQNTSIQPLLKRAEREHVYHLYVVKVPEREMVFQALRAKNIYCNVHYLPVYLHPYYQNSGYRGTHCPIAEAVYKNILSLPIYPSLSGSEQKYVIEAVLNATEQ